MCLNNLERKRELVGPHLENEKRLHQVKREAILIIQIQQVQYGETILVAIGNAQQPTRKCVKYQ